METILTPETLEVREANALEKEAVTFNRLWFVLVYLLPLLILVFAIPYCILNYQIQENTMRSEAMIAELDQHGEVIGQASQLKGSMEEVRVIIANLIADVQAIEQSSNDDNQQEPGGLIARASEMASSLDFFQRMTTHKTDLARHLIYLRDVSSRWEMARVSTTEVHEIFAQIISTDTYTNFLIRVEEMHQLLHEIIPEIDSGENFQHSDLAPHLDEFLHNIRNSEEFLRSISSGAQELSGHIEESQEEMHNASEELNRLIEENEEKIRELKNETNELEKDFESYDTQFGSFPLPFELTIMLTPVLIFLIFYEIARSIGRLRYSLDALQQFLVKQGDGDSENDPLSNDYILNSPSLNKARRCIRKTRPKFLVYVGFIFLLSATAVLLIWCFQDEVPLHHEVYYVGFSIGYIYCLIKGIVSARKILRHRRDLGFVGDRSPDEDGAVQPASS
ncbi:MAG: hypothetical protein GVY13_17960 [Alphaproteobacteria bacterium]|jgi:uncharacterized protein Yka (UPF0111/DUF47 family)|nr:hypothetical protein [Alphaproteobacteria bacterium]